MNAPILKKGRKPPLADTPISVLMGDEVRVNFYDALARAYERTQTRDVKQQVRASRNALGAPNGYWMIQDVR